MLAGDRLVHCDLNPANVLMTANGARVVDWAFTSRGSVWLECGFVIPWLMRDGHTPGQAEAWADQFAVWKQADAGHIDLFAGFLSRQWAKRDVDGADPWVKEYAGLVRQWDEFRRLS